MEALLRYFFHIDPDVLTDEEFGMRWQELRWCLKQTKPFRHEQDL